MEQFWEKILTSIEKKVSPQNFNTWFKSIQYQNTESDVVYLTVPNRFTRDWIVDHGFKEILQDEWSSFASQEVKIVLRIDENTAPEQEGVVGAPVESVPVAPIDRPEAPGMEGMRDRFLNPRYKFSEFVVGPSNQLAYAASMNVAENPGSTYNPLFIYGGSGLGKTHLLTAVGNRILTERPNARVMYTTTEKFVNEFINHIRNMTMDNFRNKYRSECDVLLIDDIQFIANKSQTQAEFFHTFNTLYESHRQIVITSDTYPQDIPELETRLKTRFLWGLIVDIQPPEIETRIAILHKKAEQEGLDIPDDVAYFIAAAANTNVRIIEGSLKRLAAFSAMYAKPINLEFARDILKDTLGKKVQIVMDDVVKVVSTFFNVKVSDLKSARRQRSISRPRQIAMYLCRQALNTTYPDIGRQFNKDHSTAITAVNNVEKMIKADASVREAVEAIKRQLGL